MKKTLPFVLFLFIILTSCSDSTTVFETTEDNIRSINNPLTLKSAVDFSKVRIVDIEMPESQMTARSMNSREYALQLVGTVSPPGEGTSLTGASHADLVDEYVYISYNTAGEQYYGSIDVVNVADPLNPSLTSRLIFEEADINAVTYDNGFIYAVGGVDAERSTLTEQNSFVVKVPVANGVIDISNGITYGYQEGFMANDLVVANNGVFVTSGSNGYLTHFDKNTLEIVNQSAQYDDLRSIAKTEDGFVALDASHGIRVFDANLNETRSAPLSADFGPDDKRTISVYNNRLAISEGETGTTIYNLQTLQEETSLGITITSSSVNSNDNVTNAVVFNDDVFLMANGGAGLSFSENQNDIELVGNLILEGSINYVQSIDDFIFAAAGREGLQVIKMNRTPDSLSESCTGVSFLNGNNIPINVAEDETLALASTGYRLLDGVSVSGELLLCGLWYTSRKNVTVEEQGIMEVNGNLLTFNGDITIKAGATLRVDGVLYVQGNITLEENARLEFIGDSNTTYAFRNVNIHPTAQVTGTFRDIYNKF